MPNLTFVLPHWLYWSGLAIFPLFAIFMVRKRQRERDQATPAVTLPIGYMLWLCGGFVGLHRFYIKSLAGLLYIPLFILILYGNVQGRGARVLESDARNNVKSLQTLVDRYTKQAVRGRSSAGRRLAGVQKEIIPVQKLLAAARTESRYWSNFSGGFAILIALFLAFDAWRLPRLIRDCAEREGPAPPPAILYGEAEGAAQRQPAAAKNTPLTSAIDAINGFVGEYVAFWSVIAVFVYFYEVVARYVFNSPTNWAHEAMFLMFGMQYLISGAYALREDSHVRVDVIYNLLSGRAKLITDITTSFFFFVFTIALLFSGAIFMIDSIAVLEVSFTEWAIQYWPVKITIALGALLLLLQGAAKLARDVLLLRERLA